MNPFNYAYDSNILLDVCSKCEGIWVDGGELQAIFEHLKNDPKGVAIRGFLQENQTANDLWETVEVLTEKRPLWEGLFMFYSIPILGLLSPLRIDTKSFRFPGVTLSIIGLCTLTFLYQAFFFPDVEAFLQKNGLIPIEFLRGVGLPTLFSHMFLHAGMIHLLGNMWFLWIFGRSVEDRFSPFGYMALYIACGLMAVLAHIAFNATSTLPIIGSSGAISGIMGAYMLFYPWERIKTLFLGKVIMIPAFLCLGIWFLLQVFYGVISRSAGVISGTAWFAHIGGFICGVALGYLKEKRNLLERK